MNAAASNNERVGKRRALVTGGSRGIGRAVVERLVRDGYDVAFTFATREDEAIQLAKGLEESFGSRCFVMRCDVSQSAEVDAVVERALADLGGLDVLINNAGITRDQSIINMSNEDWSRVTSVNLDGCFYVTRAVVKVLMRQRSGSIVNLSSAAALKGLPGLSNYAASKAGMCGFTRAIAREVAARGVTVNAVAPGFIQTDMLDAVPERMREKVLASIPLGRAGKVEEVAALTAFLASEDARYITGQVFVIDGGLVL